jgi:hypothetical protein
MPLSLTVALSSFGMRAPVGLLIIGVVGAPRLPAVQYHLGIHRVGMNLAPVVISPSMPLALRLAANALLESVRGWMKTSLAVRTAAGFGQCVSSEIERDSNSWAKQTTLFEKERCRNYCRVPTASPPRLTAARVGKTGKIAGVYPGTDTLTPQAIRNVAHRYQKGGLERTLCERARPGAAEVLDDGQKQRIIAMVCSDPPEGRARWTVRLVVEEAVKRRLVPRVGRETVRVLLLHHDLKPWREKNVVRGRPQ